MGDINGALDIADYVLEHGLALPDQYRRDAATLVAEEIAEQALRPGGPDIATADLSATEALTRDHDMPDEVRAKIHKALGLRLADEGLTAPAIEQLDRAMQLNEHIGVKKRLDQLRRELKKQQAADPA